MKQEENIQMERGRKGEENGKGRKGQKFKSLIPLSQGK